MPQQAKALAKDLSTRGRKALAVQNRVLIPHKYDQYGNLLSDSEADPLAKTYADLTIPEAKFLKAFQKNDFDLDRTCEETGKSPESGKRLYKRLAQFITESRTDAVLADVPTIDWIKARHVENILEGGEKLKGTSQESLKELRNIAQPKEKASLTINNVIAMPQLAPELMEKLKVLGDQFAEEASV